MTQNEGLLLARGEVSQLMAGGGVFLLLGRHPRANIDLAVEACIATARRGLRAVVLDCDRTITFEAYRSQLAEREASRILLSHLEDVESLAGGLRSAGSMPDVGLVVLNRASSLARASDPVVGSREKNALWRTLHPPVSKLSEGRPVLILEDSRKGEQIEYRVHPALYYLSGTILDAVEDGKSVLHYRIVKRR